jgi:hypothetical protein
MKSIKQLALSVLTAKTTFPNALLLLSGLSIFHLLYRSHHRNLFVEVLL